MVDLDFNSYGCFSFYDEKHDKSQVSQTGYIDLVEAFKNHCVPSAVGDSEVEYGNIESATNVANRADDVFDQIQKNRAFSAKLSEAKSKKEATE